MSTPRILLLALIPVAALATAGTAAAQACLGIPSRDGAIAVSGSYADLEGRSEVGGEFHADVTGPGAFGFAYHTGTEDDAPSTYEVRGAYDLYLLEPAICAVAGLRYMDVESPAISERLAVPVGFGIGKTLDAGRLAATVYAIPQYMWLREVRTDIEGNEFTDTSNEFTGEAGITLGILPLFINGAITLDTVDDDPAFRIRLGLLF